MALDLDDLLAPTERRALSVSFDILNEARAQAGLTPYPDDFRERHILSQPGKTMRVIIEYDLQSDLYPRGDLRAPAHLEKEVIDELVAKEEQKILEDFSIAPLGASPGVHEGLEMLQIGAVPYPIVTASTPQRARVTLRSAGIDEFFREQLLISCQDPDAPRPKKPDPAAYREAFDTLQAQEQFVFEDSPSGAKAGIDAGAVVLGNISCKHPENAEASAQKLLALGVSLVVENFEDQVRLVRDFLENGGKFSESLVQDIRQAGRRVWVRD